MTDQPHPLQPLAEQKARQFGGLMGSMLPKGWGYVMLMFKFGPDKAKPSLTDVTYLSNGDRQDMIDTMRAFADQLEEGIEDEEEVEVIPPKPATPPPPPTRAPDSSQPPPMSMEE